jgi:hypothetical protein
VDRSGNRAVEAQTKTGLKWGSENSIIPLGLGGERVLCRYPGVYRPANPTRRMDGAHRVTERRLRPLTRLPSDEVKCARFAGMLGEAR